MRILFLTGQLVYNARILEAYTQQRPQDQIRVIASNYILKGQSTWKSLKTIARQSGLDYVLYKMYEAFGTQYLSGHKSLHGICHAHQIPLNLSADVNDAPTVNIIKEFAPDLILSMINQKIKTPVLSIARRGVINVHPGLLPDYRGLGPYLWPLIHGAKDCGCTLHWITDEQLDTGDVIVKASYAIEAADTAQSLYWKNALLGANLLPQAVQRLEEGELPSMAQRQGHYYSWPLASDIKRCRQQGRRLIRTRDLWQMRHQATAAFSHQNQWA